jgi:hypothetical protein
VALPVWAQLAWRLLALLVAAVLTVVGLLCRTGGDAPHPLEPIDLRRCDTGLLAATYALVAALAGSGRLLLLALAATVWALACESTRAETWTYDLFAIAGTAIALAILFFHFWVHREAAEQPPPHPSSDSGDAEPRSEALLPPSDNAAGSDDDLPLLEDGYGPLSEEAGGAGAEDDEPTRRKVGHRDLTSGWA